MSRTLISFALLIAIALPLVDYAMFRPGRKALGGSARKPRIERLIYGLFLLAVAIQGLTSFGTLLKGEAMRGWALVAHMSSAGVFAVCLTALALLWAEQSTFHRVDSRFYTGEKVAFWVTVLAGFVTLTSAMFAMMGWWGSPTQATIMRVHRYAALALLVAAIFHGYRLLVGRPRVVVAADVVAAPK